MLPSAIDDVDMGVTHVVRGEDHVSNTALQLQMFEALGAPPPALRARGAADRGGGQAVEAARLARRRPFPRGRDRAAGAARAARADRDERSGRAGGRRGAADRTRSTSRASAARRRGSTRPSWRSSTRGSSTSCDSRRSRIGCRREWAQAAWEAVRPNLTTRRRGGGLVAGDRGADRRRRRRRRGPRLSRRGGGGWRRRSTGPAIPGTR